MRSKLLSVTIALLASVCLWLYVVNVINPEETTSVYGIPITFSGEEELRSDQGLIITEGSTQTVTLKFSGKRLALQKLTAENIAVRVDVSRIKKADTYEMSYEIETPSEVSRSDFTVTERTPGLIQFKVEKLATKTVEVRGVFDGQVAEGYMADAMTYDYEELVIEGPEAIVGKVGYAQVILTRTNLDKTVTASLPYILVDGDKNPVDATEITANAEEIKVTLPVLKFKDIPLKVDFIEGGGATMDNVVCEISPQTVTVAGDAAILDGINQLVLDNIDLSDITNSTTLFLPIALPNGLKNISGDETAEVSLKIKGLDTKTIRITNLAPVNVPQGYTPTVMATMLQIVVRAPSSEIAKISAADLRAEADLSGPTKEGTYNVPVTVYIDGFAKAGVIGDYFCGVSLSRE